MKATKILMLLLSFLLIFGTILTFVGCGGTPTNECTEHKDENGDGICDTAGCGVTVEKKPDGNNDAFNENGELYLFKGGVPTFQFVIGSDALSNHKGAVEDLAEVINKINELKDEDKIKTVTQGDPAQDVEILIGTVTNRGNEYMLNKYDYGNTGYVVKQIGTKLVITGGSDTAINNAISYLKSSVFGIKKNNDPFVDFVMTADKTYDVKQSNYALKEITVADNSIRDYVISYNDKSAQDSAINLQKALYDKCGIRLEVMSEATAKDKPRIAFRLIENDGEGGGYYVTVDDTGNLIIECEYKSRFTELSGDFWDKNVFNKKNILKIGKDYNYSPNYRDIYYRDYAKGDGKTDDFEALKTVHELANENLLNVHADKDQTYYIGAANGTQSIIVKTNTYWHGCKFIFDDTEVNWKNNDKTTPIFKISPDVKGASYDKASTPVTSLEKGATSIGWAPGSKVLLVIYQSDIRHYIRYGTNADNGKEQHEIILVDAAGNIDPSTPVQWTYTSVTQIDLYFVDDREIEIRGEGENGEMTEITTWHNHGPNTYWYFSRNIDITRSNVTVSGIKHAYDKYTLHADGGTGCPYTGFTQVTACNNVTIDNFIFESAPRYKDDEADRSNRPSSMPSPTNGSMGTYEISAELSNNVVWSNSKQSNFFNADGTLHTNGLAGTNYCKNLVYDNMQVTTFDAHCGVYNVTIKNSILMTANIIGAGKIIIKDVISYADGQQRSPISLRDDYGSTFDGDAEIDGLHVKIKKITADEEKAFNNQGRLRVFNVKYHNHNFGYTTYLPENISIRNLLVEEYTVSVVNGKRVEAHSDYNNYEISLFAKDINVSAYDLYRDKYFGSNENVNRMVPCKKIELFTEYTGKYAEMNIDPLNFVWPSKTHSNGSTMFKSTEYWMDGVLQ